MANRPIDLTNFNAADTDNPDGTLKDQVYSAPGVVSQVGSEAKASFITDLLNVFQWLVRENRDTLSGVTDSQAVSQFIDGFVAKIDETAGRAAVQQGLSNFKERSLNYGYGNNTGAVAYGNGIWVRAALASSGYIIANVIDAITDAAYDIHDTAVGGGSVTSDAVWDGTNFVVFEDAEPVTGDMYCYTSPAGVTWTARTVSATTLTTDEIRAVAVLAGILIAPLNSSVTPTRGIVFSSADNGATWTENAVTGDGLPTYPACSVSSSVMMMVGGTSGISYSTSGTHWLTVPIAAGANITQLVYNGRRFVAFVSGSSTYYISSTDDSGAMVSKSLPHGAVGVDSALASNGVTVVHDPVNNVLMSATQQGIIDEEWKVHPFPFYTTGGTLIADNKLVTGNDEQILFLGNTTDSEKIAITPPIQR